MLIGIASNSKVLKKLGNFCYENIIFPKLFIFSKEIMFLSYEYKSK